MKSEHGYIESGNEKLHVALTLPEVATDKSVLICEPLCEERRCALRTTVRLAEKLASAAGIAALRFDYAGTGDSTGDFAEMSVEQWKRDIASAAGVCREYGRQLHIIAMRGSALLAASSSVPCQCISLVAPLKSGKEYLHQLELRNRLKSEIGGVFQVNAHDFGGFVFNEECYMQMASLDLGELCGSLPQSCKLNVVMVGAGKSLPASWQNVVQRTAGIEFVQEMPFWGQTDYFESERLMDVLLQLVDKTDLSGE